MSVLIRHYKVSRLASAANTKIWRFSSTAPDANNEEEEFRVLDIVKSKQRRSRFVNKRTDVQPDRTDRMATDQNWANVWPGPKTFHPSSVPLPLRQGYVPKGRAPPGKKANAELMKIPNFLHLTPPAIKAQCEAIKKFCTPWPKLLNSEEAIEQHYPIEVITSDYCHASPCIRNPMARVVNLRFKLSDIKLDPHAKDKFLRLIGERYDEKTGYVTLISDRCPIRKQNLDYVNYLLTACYHEAWSFEEWEKDKSENDMEYYRWDVNASKRNLVTWYHSTKGEAVPSDWKSFDVSCIDGAESYKQAVSTLWNDGENDATLLDYDRSVRQLLGLPPKTE